mmetsp:Transcript_55110/g.162014  ORF Transcript_55110/g.162014 Transcript_55110/m.162014 type:complete len:251 (-) Transcript_55110:1986-2738(-)
MQGALLRVLVLAARPAERHGGVAVERRLRLRDADVQLLAPHADRHRAALGELAGEDHVAQAGDEVALEPALDRPRAQLGVVGLLEDQVDSLVRQLQRHVQLLQAPEHVLQLQAHHLAQHVAAERVEDDDVVEAIQKLGPQRASDDGHGLLLRLLDLGRGGLFGRHAQHVLCAQVRRHEHDAVLAVDHVALGVRDAAVVEQLEEDVEHLRVRLLHLVEEHDAVGVAAQGLRELAAGVMADVARRRTDESGD